LADGALIYFGDDQDTTLTHSDGSGLTLNSTNKLMFNDATQFIQGSSATVLSLGATDEIDLTATAIDINGTCDISGTFSLAGVNVTSTAAELNILDGVTSTAAELNLIDGGTARGTDAVATGDGILINDAGTMKMTNVDTVSTYFSSHNVGGSNIVTTGALDSGSITSGFGNIDTGSSTITTTGAVATGDLTITGIALATTDTDATNTGSVTLDFSANQNFVLTLTGNVTLANPTTESVGQSGIIVLIQDGTGSRTLAVGDQYFGAGGAVPEISTAANAIDVIPYFVQASGKILLGAAQLAFADAS
jgi:hypothetical protein